LLPVDVALTVTSVTLVKEQTMRRCQRTWNKRWYRAGLLDRATKGRGIAPGSRTGHLRIRSL